MRLLWALGLSVMMLAFLVPFGSALPMKPDKGKILEHEVERQTHYPPARVAWNGPETRRKPFNPVYESMKYPLSPEAMQAKLLAVAIPSPGMLFSIAALIFLLRLLRKEREARIEHVVTMTKPNLPAKEAA